MAATAEAALAKRRKERRERAGFKIGVSASLGQHDDEGSGERFFTDTPRNRIRRNWAGTNANSQKLTSMDEADAHVTARLYYRMGNAGYKQGAWRTSQSWLTLTPKGSENKRKAPSRPISRAMPQVMKRAINCSNTDYKLLKCSVFPPSARAVRRRFHVIVAITSPMHTRPATTRSQQSRHTPSSAYS